MEVLVLAFLLGYVIWKGSAALSERAARPRAKPPEPELKPQKQPRPAPVLTVAQQAAALRKKFAEYCTLVETMPVDADSKTALKFTAREKLTEDLARLV